MLQVTEAQRNQIMGHAQASVSAATMHQTVKVDTQSAYLGTVNRSNLIKSVGRMSNKKGPRAPVKLSAEELKSHQDHPKLVTLLLEQSRLTTTLRAECRSVRAAETLQPERYQEYLRLNGQISRVEENLKRTALRDFQMV